MLEMNGNKKVDPVGIWM